MKQRVRRRYGARIQHLITQYQFDVRRGTVRRNIHLQQSGQILPGLQIRIDAHPGRIRLDDVTCIVAPSTIDAGALLCSASDVARLT